MSFESALARQRGVATAQPQQEAPDIIGSIKDDMLESFRAAQTVLGLYKPSTTDEAIRLRRRFMADAAATGVGLVTGGAGSIAMKSAPALARGIISGVLSGAATGGTWAGVQGEPVLPAAAAGAIGGGVISGVGHVAASGAMGALDMGATLTKRASKSLETKVKVRGIKQPRQSLPYEATVVGSPETIRGLFSGLSGSHVDDGFGTATIKPTIRAAHAVASDPALPSTARVRAAARKAGLSAAADDGAAAGEGNPVVQTRIAVGALERRVADVVDEDASLVIRDLGGLSRRVLMPVETVLNRMGEVGQRLSGQMATVLSRTQLNAGDDVVRIRAALAPLKKADRIHVADVLRGEAVAKDDSIQLVVDEMRDILDNVGLNAHGVKLREWDPTKGHPVNFRYRSNYYPLIYDESAARSYLKPGKARERAIDWILQHDHARDRAGAERLLERFVHTPPEFRYGNLQIARTLSMPGFERDPLKALPKYVYRSWKRIETAREFGPADELAEQAFAGLAAEGQDDVFAREAYAAFADRAPRRFANLVRATREFNVLTLLWTAGLVQPAQLSNVAAMTGYKNLLKGLGGVFSKHGRDWAEGTGAALGETIQAMMPAGEGGWGTHWLNFIGLTAFDKANRMTAALAGRYYAQDLASKFLGKQSGQVARRLRMLDLVPEEILSQNGILNEEQLRTAALAVANKTQFRSSVLDLPLFKQTPLGDFMLLFKSFAIQQFRFTANLAQEARKGDIAPLLRYMTMTGTLTPAVGMAVRLARGKLGDEGTIHGEYVKSMLDAGAVGIASDALAAMDNGPARVASFIGGPTAGQLYEFIGRDVPSAAEGNFRPVLRDAIRHVPGFGRYIVDWIAP